jgi:hypothetical protein
MNEEVFKHSMLDVTWNHSRGPPIGGFDGDDTRLASGEEVSGAQSMKTWAVVVEVRTQLWKLVEQDPLLLLLSCNCGWGTYYLHSPLGDGNLEPAAFMKVRAWWIWTPDLISCIMYTKQMLCHMTWSQFTQDSRNNSSTWHTGLSIPVPAML